MAACVRLAEPPEFFRATVCRAATPSTPMARISTDTITSIRLMPCWDLRAKDGMLLLTMSVVSRPGRSEEHTSELQSLMRISYAVFCLKKKQENKRLAACLI